MHDANGNKLNVGDKVMIPCEVTGLSEGTEEYCNVSLKTTLGRRPDGEKENFSAVNTAQVVKLSGGEVNLQI